MDLAPILTSAGLLILGSAATLAAGELQANRRRREMLEDTQAEWERSQARDRELWRRERDHERAVWLRDRRIDVYTRYQQASDALADALQDGCLVRFRNVGQPRGEVLQAVISTNLQRVSIMSEIVMLAEDSILRLVFKHDDTIGKAMSAIREEASPTFKQHCDETRYAASAAMVDLLAAIRQDLGVEVPKSTGG